MVQSKYPGTRSAVRMWLDFRTFVWESDHIFTFKQTQARNRLDLSIVLNLLCRRNLCPLAEVRRGSAGGGEDGGREPDGVQILAATAVLHWFLRYTLVTIRDEIKRGHFGKIFCFIDESVPSSESATVRQQEKCKIGKHPEHSRLRGSSTTPHTWRILVASCQILRSKLVSIPTFVVSSLRWNLALSCPLVMKILIFEDS